MTNQNLNEVHHDICVREMIKPIETINGLNIFKAIIQHPQSEMSMRKVLEPIVEQTNIDIDTLVEWMTLAMKHIDALCDTVPDELKYRVICPTIVIKEEEETNDDTDAEEQLQTSTDLPDLPPCEEDVSGLAKE